MKNFIASWTKLNDDNICPYKFWLCHGSKYWRKDPIIPFTDNAVTLKGKAKHKAIEYIIKGLNRTGILLPGTESDLIWQAWWTDMLIAFVQEYPENEVEMKIGLDEQWQAHELGEYYKPLFYEGNIILHSAIDFICFDKPRARAETAVIIDWKSGKYREPEKYGQLAMYALLAMSLWRNLQSVDCVYVYLDQKIQKQQKWLRWDMPALQEKFSTKIAVMQHHLGLKDRVEVKTGNCHWCPATKEHCQWSKKN